MADNKELRSEIDEQVNSALMFAGQYASGLDFEDCRYFAADVIGEVYNGKYSKGLACACQCFLYSRLAHINREKLSAGAVLAGDYFAGLIPSFELPENKAEILDKFSGFTIDEIRAISAGAELTFDEERYRRLFLEVAGEMDE